MQSTWFHRVSLLRGGGLRLTLRRGVMGVLASALAVAGLVVFATEASAHDNYFESVTANCNAPGYGEGATLTWTLFNDWAQSETGTLTTAQGLLGTSVLSIAASPENNATPATGAASQTFTQVLTASELAALTPTTPITVNWSSTWTDGTHVTGVLTTTLSVLNLPNGCVGAKSTPTIQTSLVAPSSSTIGNSWGDSATVTGSTGGPAPAGSVSFYVCQAASGSTCTSGGSLVGTTANPSSSSGNQSTYSLAGTYTPTSVGTYCFYTAYTPTSNEPYLAASGPAECFAVTPAYPGIQTTIVPPSSPTVGQAWSDSATVNGVFGGGTPYGTVTFGICKASSSDTSTATCTYTSPGGTTVGSVSTPSSTTDTSATYNLLPTTYTPPSTGTYCFYTLYEPANSVVNYNPVWGQFPECFGVHPNGPSSPTVTTQQSASTSGSGSIVLGGSVTDTATVAGNSANGAPTGTVTFTECSTGSSPALCPNGTEVGTAPVALTPGSGLTSTATSVSFTPPAVGTYCFAAAYTPGAGSHYSPATDNIGGTVATDECFTVTAPPTAPNFTVTKSDTPGNGVAVTPGSTIDYTVGIKNVGNGTGSATVTDNVPSSLTVQHDPVCTVAVSTDSCTVGNPAGSTWTFTVSLAAGDTATATFAAVVASTATGTITNTATITDGTCTTSAGCSSTVSNNVTPVTSPAVTVATTPPTPAPVTAPATAPVTAPATTPATIAFTGARLEQEWLFGLGAALMGAAFIVIARLRRRPRTAEVKK
jgi:hypothetical protein